MWWNGTHTNIADIRVIYMNVIDSRSTVTERVQKVARDVTRPSVALEFSKLRKNWLTIRVAINIRPSTSHMQLHVYSRCTDIQVI